MYQEHDGNPLLKPCDSSKRLICTLKQSNGVVEYMACIGAPKKYRERTLDSPFDMHSFDASLTRLNMQHLFQMSWSFVKIVYIAANFAMSSAFLDFSVECQVDIPTSSFHSNSRSGVAWWHVSTQFRQMEVGLSSCTKIDRVSTKRKECWSSIPHRRRCCLLSNRGCTAIILCSLTTICHVALLCLVHWRVSKGWDYRIEPNSLYLSRGSNEIKISP